ncbi:MAG TPA: nucleoside kinase [Candidatus Cloacimonadota bacterium]|nr:nucleoside kinase [Candidatus Cloacimonadota bacterium]HPT73160.1 nucleoside kinase [Candidatus Cloacimonadota bacterium]
MKIEISVDDQFSCNYESETPITVSELFSKIDVPNCDSLCYKLNQSKFVPIDFLIADNASINCISYRHPEGYRIYQDSTIFIMAKAFYNLFPSPVKLVIEHSIGDGIYCEVFGKERFTEVDTNALKTEMQRIVQMGTPINIVKCNYEEAEKIFRDMGRKDLLDNLDYYSPRTIPLYQSEDYYDFYIRPLATSAALIKEYDIIYHSPGFILRFPPEHQEKISSPFVLPKQLFITHQEHDKWLNILKVHNMVDLNRLVDEYRISDFILVEEALHEKKIANIADEIVNKTKAKIILIAGPSSSGKTTFAKRIAVQLKVCGVIPMVIGMDDYFLPRTQTPLKPNGEYDFESIDALDLKQLNEHLQILLDGGEVELPKYNFTQGVQVNSHRKISLGKNNVIVMEGIHGLNEKLTASIPYNQKVKIYVSALNQLNIDDHNRIPTTDCRKLRRLVRDYKYRGYSAEETLMRWASVREGEDKNIFPFQEEADFMFNSSLTYELGVLKRHAMTLLTSVSKYSPAHTEAHRLMRMLDFVKEIPDNQVPLNSILREFTNGSLFRY